MKISARQNNPSVQFFTALRGVVPTTARIKSVLFPFGTEKNAQLMDISGSLQILTRISDCLDQISHKLRCSRSIHYTVVA